MNDFGMNLHIQGSIPPNIHISIIVFQSLFLDYYICSYNPGTGFLCYSLNKQTKTLCKVVKKHFIVWLQECIQSSSALYFYRALGLVSHLGKPSVSWFRKYVFLQMYTLADIEVL